MLFQMLHNALNAEYKDLIGDSWWQQLSETHIYSLCPFPTTPPKRRIPFVVDKEKASIIFQGTEQYPICLVILSEWTGIRAAK